MEDYLFFISMSYGIEILSFVLMDNHFHLLARDPHLNLSAAMNYFMKETSRYMSSKARIINQIYGGRYHRCLITHPHYLHHVYKYIYRNPLEAGLCHRAEDYPYSTLGLSLGKGRLHFPLYPDEILFESCDQTLRWINDTPNSYDTEVIKQSLRKGVFDVATDRRTGRPRELLLNPY